MKNDNAMSFDNEVITVSGADYAEYFRWNDGNPNEEDRVGHFVTFADGETIRYATPEDTYILGVTTGSPSNIGNGDGDLWQGRYLRDEFGRHIYVRQPKYEFNPETGKMEEVYDENGNLIYSDNMVMASNPNYDTNRIPPSDSPEWFPIGFAGEVSVIHDGTCKVNGYCTVGENGIATACDEDARNSYRVVRSMTDTVVRIVVK